MHDIDEIRSDPDGFAQSLARRGLQVDVGEILRADENRRAAIAALQQAQERRNRISQDVRAVMARGDQTRVNALSQESRAVGAMIAEREEAVTSAKASLAALLLGLPNLPYYAVPEGTGPADNAVTDEVAPPTPPAGTVWRDHADLGRALGLMSPEDGAALAGSRFTVLRGDLARLARALGQFMLDRHTNETFEEIDPPALVHPPALVGTGQLPRFQEDLFVVLPGSRVLTAVDGSVRGITAGVTPHYLIPTAEVPLTNLHAGQIIEVAALPRLYAALTPCFRAEAGSAGRDTTGLLRQHQFMKCELVAIARPDQAHAMLKHLLTAARSILDLLELPYRVVHLCAGDLGPSAKQTYDLEVWMPGQGQHREIASISWCGDFQARRMNTRFRELSGRLSFVHTLNGSGVAVGRALAAVMENYQQPDGSIVVPSVLRPYMGGRDVITARTA